MKWNEITADQKLTVLQKAAVRYQLDEEASPAGNVTANRLTNADLVALARGMPTVAPASVIKFAMRTDPALRHRFDRILDRYSRLRVPNAAAASDGLSSRRRDPSTGLEIEWVESTAEPNSVFVKVLAPPSMRPASRLLLRDGDEFAIIALNDDGQDDLIEVLIARDSDEFRLLSKRDSLLWLS